ncbi:hypothetical protein DEO72_LG9g1899 [Vigna unguiculata]|uniref:TF-B3 domain-containing protein n=1 Tax=Vigna unguiculata TaxID=3917 RepID=A0A4D6N461_VIGUN|nr:hypothetical protein DEO72_LG9g1899 [Vigna unguiculata]
MASYSSLSLNNFHPCWLSVLNPIKFPKPVRSVKFFTCFCVDFPLQPGSIIFDDAFSHFWGPIFDSSNPNMYQKVKMIDPVGKNYEVFIEGSYTGRIFARHGLEKMVTNYDLREDQYLDFEFASRALVKNKKYHEIHNTNGCSWSCTVRWAKKRTYECFLSCGWKKFCAENGFQAGDVITFGVDINRSNIINVRKD